MPSKIKCPANSPAADCQSANRHRASREGNRGSYSLRHFAFATASRLLGNRIESLSHLSAETTYPTCDRSKLTAAVSPVRSIRDGFHRACANKGTAQVFKHITGDAVRLNAARLRTDQILHGCGSKITEPGWRQDVAHETDRGTDAGQGLANLSNSGTRELSPGTYHNL